MDDINAIHKEENIFSAVSDTNNLVDTTEIKTATNNIQITEKNSVLEYCPEDIYESSDKNATHPCLQADLQFKENNGKYKLNITPSNGPSTVQKEHLLEMASEVANILTDDIDDNESTLGNLDAKCRYQFVNTYLEEQKQLMNDLHVRISCYVSIVEFTLTLFILYYILMLLFSIKIK